MVEPFDVDTRRLSGDGPPVAERSRRSDDRPARLPSPPTGCHLPTGASHARSSPPGPTARVAGRRRWVRPCTTSNPTLSPDGKRVAVGRRDSRPRRRLWPSIRAWDRIALTFDPADDFDPVFSWTERGSVHLDPQGAADITGRRRPRGRGRARSRERERQERGRLVATAARRRRHGRRRRDRGGERPLGGAARRRP